MITKHNDFDGLAQLKSKTPIELRQIVAAGLIQIGSFDTQKVTDQQDTVLSDDFYVGWSHPNEIRNKGFKVDWTRYRHAPRSFARIFSKTKEGSMALRDGMVQYAQTKGLSPDAAYNWSRSFDPARFVLIEALAELERNPELRNYIRTVPIMGGLQVFKNWMYNAPTNNPDFGILDQRSIVNVSSLADKVLRERYTAKECFEMRQDHLEEKARRQGREFTRAVFQERAPGERPPRRDGQRPQHQRRDAAPNQPATAFDKFRNSVESDIPRRQETQSKGSERATTILSVKPDYEERQQRKSRKGNGDRRKDNDRTRNDNRWR